MHREVTVKRDFCSLTAAEALRIAILVEERNAQIYQQLGDLFLQFCPDFPSLALSFLELETTERHHATMLSTRFRERYGNLNLRLRKKKFAISLKSRNSTLRMSSPRSKKGSPARRDTLRSKLPTLRNAQPSTFTAGSPLIRSIPN